MSMTITATFEVATIDEHFELVASLRELEAVHIEMAGCVAVDGLPTFPDRPWTCDRCGSHDFSRATAINDHEVVCGDCADAAGFEAALDQRDVYAGYDDAPPQGIERPYWAADEPSEEQYLADRAAGHHPQDPCTDPFCTVEHEPAVHEWDELATEPPAVTREAVTSRLYGQLLVACAYHVSKDSWLACVSNWATQARVPGVHGTSPTTLMGDMIALSTFMSDSHEFYAVCRELGRDCWGDVHCGVRS